MNEEEAFEFAAMIARYLRQELTPEEEEHFIKLIQRDPKKQEILNAYKDTAEIQQRLAQMNQLDLKKGWTNILTKQKRKKRIQKIKWIGYAALLVLIGSISFWRILRSDDRDIVKINKYGYKNDVLPNNGRAKLTLSNGKFVSLGEESMQLTEKEGSKLRVKKGELLYANEKSGIAEPEEIFNTLQVERGGLYKIILPDGTLVWVNSLSSMRFPVRFSKNERKVFLEGEAYFEVASDLQRPFTVVANRSEINVLGTKFDTKTGYAVTTTTLLEGSVKVNSGSKYNILIPGQQAEVNALGINLKRPNIDKVVAWKEGQFYFDHDEIQHIMEELAAWYGVEVRYESNILAGRYGGSISRKVSLGEVLEMLKDISDLDFEIDGRKVIVKKDKNV